MAVVGTGEFDVTEIDIESLELARADGVGGSVTPLMGPPGPKVHAEDVATPFFSEACACHELEGDGIDDLSLKFDTPTVVAALELDELPGGTFVDVLVSGELLDGCQFIATDCVRLVPAGSGSGKAGVMAQDRRAGPGEDGAADASEPEEVDGDQADDWQALVGTGMGGCGGVPPAFLLTTVAGMWLVRRRRLPSGRTK
jgi:hypothetical protein